MLAACLPLATAGRLHTRSFGPRLGSRTQRPLTSHPASPTVAARTRGVSSPTRWLACQSPLPTATVSSARPRLVRSTASWPTTWCRGASSCQAPAISRWRALSLAQAALATVQRCVASFSCSLLCWRRPHQIGWSSARRLKAVVVASRCGASSRPGQWPCTARSTLRRPTAARPAPPARSTWALLGLSSAAPSTRRRCT